MKVSVLGIRGIPNVPGGVETHAEQLYRRLSDLGCDVEVIVRSPFVAGSQKSVGRIRLRRIWAPRHAGLEAFVHSVLGVLYAGWTRPDILHIHAVGPAIVTPLARLLGLKVVVTHHGPDYDRDKWGGFARAVLRLGERLGMRWAQSRIVISRVIQDLVARKHGRQSTLIPNGVEAVQPSAATDSLTSFGLTPGKYFLQVSRIVPEKRQLDLIRAYAQARAPGWKMVLVGAAGTDDYSREVERGAAAEGVVLAGFQTGEPLRQFYSHAGAFILPSSHEGLPIALLEALSYGLNVLASDIPANLEMGLDEACYFPMGDVEGLACALRRIAAAPVTDAGGSKRATAVAAKYNWENIARQTLQVYETTRRRTGG